MMDVLLRIDCNGIGSCQLAHRASPVPAFSRFARRDVLEVRPYGLARRMVLPDSPWLFFFGFLEDRGSGGDVCESNTPETFCAPHNGFEGRGAHQDPTVSFSPFHSSACMMLTNMSILIALRRAGHQSGGAECCGRKAVEGQARASAWRRAFLPAHPVAGCREECLEGRGRTLWRLDVAALGAGGLCGWRLRRSRVVVGDGRRKRPAALLRCGSARRMSYELAFSCSARRGVLEARPYDVAGSPRARPAACRSASLPCLRSASAGRPGQAWP